jgi:hypothetical protein
MKQKGGVCVLLHTLGLPFTLTSIFKAKEELWKIQIFHHAKIIKS